MRDQILSFLDNLQLTYALPRSNSAVDENEHVIPHLLNTAPNITFEDMINPSLLLEDAPQIHRVDRVVQFQHLPQNLFFTFMIRLVHLSSINSGVKCNSFWKTGIAINSPDKLAVGLIDCKQNAIAISVRGTRPEPLLRIILGTLNLLIENHFHVAATEKMTCSHCLKTDQSPPTLFTKEECKIAIVSGESCVKCRDVAVPLISLVPELLLADMDQLRVEYSDLEMGDIIGKGSFGEIRTAIWRGEKIAVKQITTTSCEETLKAFREWRSEVSVMNGLHHENLIALRGFCLKPFCILMELAPKGTLYEFIHDESIAIDWNVRLKIARDIAAGLNYMHECQMPMIHRDVKSPNILMVSTDVNSPAMAKVADFGLTTPLFIPEFRTRFVDQPMWLAPEIMSGSLYAEKADVYAFGIILWELVARSRPFDEFPFANWGAQLEDSIVAGTRPTIPSNCHPLYKKLISDCWHTNPRHRPPFRTILQILQTIAENIAEFDENDGKSRDLAISGYAFDLPDSEDTIIKEEFGKRHDLIAKSGTLLKLVEKVTSDQREHDFVSEFAHTFTSFASPRDVLMLCLQRFHGPPDDSTPPQKLQYHKEKFRVQERVLELLVLILKRKIPIDDDTNESLQEFSENYLKDNTQASANIVTNGSLTLRGKNVKQDNFLGKKSTMMLAGASLQSLGLVAPSAFSRSPEYERLEGELKRLIGKLRKHPLNFPSPSKGYSSTNLLLPRRNPKQISTRSLSDIDSVELAEQWILLETALFQSIRTTEFLDQAWNKEGRDKQAKNLTACIEWFTQSRDWVSTEILKGESTTGRATTIIIFIQIGMKFLELHNYSGIMQILSSLHSEGISALQQTWKEIPRKCQDNLATLSELMNPLHNFQNYREHIQSLPVNQEFIPYVGVILNDVVLLDETSEWNVGESMINFGKVRSIGAVLSNFSATQGKCVVYGLKIKPNPSTQEYILSAEIWTDADILRLSTLRENYDKSLAKGDTSETFSSRHGFKNYVIGRGNIATDINSLSAREWDLLLTNAHPVVYNRDDVIFEEGSVNHRLYRVKKGTFRVEKKGKDGNSVLLTKISPPAMFGEMSFLGTNTSASIIADENKAELWVLEINIVKKLFDSDPDLFRTFYQYLATILAKRLKNMSSTKSGESPSQNSSEAEVLRSSSSSSRPEDVKFQRRFKLDRSEIIIKDYNCAYRHISGHLFLSKQHISFYSKVFGLKKKKLFALSVIKTIMKSKKTDIELFTTYNSKFKISFSSQDARDEAFDMMDSLWQSFSSNSRLFKKLGESSELNDEDFPQDPEMLTTEDWQLLLQGAKCVTFRKDEPIVTEGQYFQRIYQIVQGSCRIEKSNKRLGTMEEGQSFGEVSFLLSGGASASVIAESDQTEVYILEGYYINVLFGIQPELAGRFYKYLADTLQRTIRSREEG
eukprot:TRINITY_DN4008_c0_g1_i4.p1 TRINITY_DN4008_c0_g1~~TRINITY_DN4008_c0_g1_i4.p1  ORF type:complete len:1425 (+),score=391.51 TRINITY_DN4008_c0_g1_i4:717-4991(+)